jgi:hypothetical protein
MTKEQYTLAQDYVHDIDLLDSIRNSQLKDHWVNFTTPDGCDGSAYSEVFIDDFEEWVQKEKEKLEKLLEEL